MQILAALDRVRSTGTDKWVALCPCHDEKTPSLNISIASNGNVMIYCFGCGANGLEVYRTLGLNLDELFGGKKLESNYIPQEIRTSHDLETVVTILHQCDLDNKKPISLIDRRRNRLAIARLAGIEKKFPHITN